MTPLTPAKPVQLVMNLAPTDQVHFSPSKTSGGQTFKRVITIEGVTTPGSIVLEDGKEGSYSFGHAALATDARGFFQTKVQNREGINTFNFKVLDPFGHQYIRSFPVFWSAFARPGSPLSNTQSNLSGGQ
jgi:hypothetical protein